MIPRVSLIAALVLGCGSAWAAPAAQRPQPVAENSAPISFYVTKGPPGACGQGCDSWIAAEGRIDNAAAARFRKFLHQLGGRQLSIYFHSPGGNLEQALAIGSMLRDRKAVARVGRTVVRECGFEAQDGDVCVKLKQSGRELHGEFWTRGAMCNSACPYLILGAVTREVAPDAALAVHSPRVLLSFTGVAPPREVRAQALQQALARSDRMVLDYIRRMGADPGLLKVARSVRFEDMHVLTREEIAGFGIDRRRQIETPWVFENASRGVVYKTAIRRDDGAPSFKSTQLRLLCIDAGHFELGFQRPVSAAAGFTSVAMMTGGERLQFSYPPRKLNGQEFWGVWVSGKQLQAAETSADAELTEGDLAAGHWQFQSTRLSNEGLPAALQSLRQTCPPDKPAATPVASRDSAAK
jgi:hypothetical protein